MHKTLQCFIILLSCLATILPTPAASAQTAPVEVTQNQIQVSFPETLTFQVKAEAASTITSLKLLYGSGARSCQNGQASLEPDFTPGQTIAAEWTWELKRSGALPIGAQVWWQWQFTLADGGSYTTPRQEVTIEDNRHTWNTLSQDGVTVYWYEGRASFGQYLLQVALDSLSRLELDMGVVSTNEITIIAYPTAEEVREALIVTSEWAGGVALPEYNATIVGIAPDELDWAAEVIPHELAHLVTSTRIFNCKGGRLNTWLNEGLAVYAEGPLSSLTRQSVLTSLDQASLPPLSSLANGFSAYGDEARLSYDQSALMIEYLLATYGPEQMDAFLSYIQSGLPVNTALVNAFGLDTAGLDAAWRTSLGYETVVDNSSPDAKPTRTPIPTIALWTPAVGASATEITPPAATVIAAVSSPTSTLTPTSLSEPTNTPAAPAGSPTASGAGWLFGIAAAGAAALFVILLILRRR